MTAFVYVMECADAECIKIGIAKDVGRRLEGIQSGNPLEVTIIYSREFEERRAAQVERAAHRHFKAQRVRGEWFRVSTEDAERFIASQPDDVVIADAPVDSVVDWIGGQGALASLLGVTRAAISQWRTVGIPANRAVQIERMTSGKFKAAVIARDEAA